MVTLIARVRINRVRLPILLVFSFSFFSFFSFISLIADGPHHYHPACGHKGSSHLSPVHALHFFLSRCKFSTLTTRQPVAEQGKSIFPCPRSRLRIWSRETGSAVPSRVNLLIFILMLNLVLTYEIPPEFRGGVHLFN